MRSVLMGVSAGLALWAGGSLLADTSEPCGPNQCCNRQTGCGFVICGLAGSTCNCCFCGSGAIAPFVCCATSIVPMINCTTCCLGAAPPGGGGGGGGD